MPISLQDFKTQYPDYASVPDQELADKLHEKFYSNIPKDQFYTTIKFDPNKDEGFVARTGRYEEQNLAASVNDITQATQPFKPDNQDDSAIRQGIERVGQYVGGPVMGAMGVVTSPATSVVASGVRSGIDATGAMENSTPQQKDAVSQTVGSTVTNVGLGYFGGGADEVAKVGSNILSSSADLRSAKDIRASQNTGGILDNTSTTIGGVKATAPDVFVPVAEGLKQSKSSAPIDVSTAGMENLNKINRAFDSKKEVQRQSYADLDKTGSQFSMTSPQIYNGLKDITTYLKEKVGIKPEESSALRRLQEIQDSLESKYEIASTPDKVQQLPSWKQPMVVKKGEEGVDAYGVQPSDLVEIKAALNNLYSKSGQTTSEDAIISQFKSKVQADLDNAAKISPEFGQKLKIAEAAATDVSKFRGGSMSKLWDELDDYSAWKAKQNNPTNANLTGEGRDTRARAGRLLDTLNTGDEGTIKAVIDTLGPDQATEVFRDAILNAKQKTTVLNHLVWQLRNITRSSDVTSAAGGVLNPYQKINPIVDLAKRATPGSPIPVGGAAAATAGALGLAATKSENNKKKTLLPEAKQPIIGPKSENQGNVNEPNTSVIADSGSTPVSSGSNSSSKKNDILSYLNPISDAEAATVEGATKNLNPSSAMGKRVKQFSETEDKPALEQAGKKYRVDMTEAMTLHNLETSVKGANESNGYLQITPSAWKQAERITGKKLNRDDPKDYAEAGMAYYKWTRDQVKDITKSAGQPAIKDVYIAYNAGIGGFKALMSADPSAIAAKVVGSKTADNNKHFYYDKDGKPLTVAQTKKVYYSQVKSKMDEVSPAPKPSSKTLAFNTTSSDNEPDMEPIKR